MPLNNKEFGFHGSFKPEGNVPHQIQRGAAANKVRPHVEKHLKHALEIYKEKLKGTKLAKHYDSLTVDSKMVDHFLDSKHGRELAGADTEDNFAFHDQLRKSAGEFMSHYKPELHENAIGDFLDTHHTKAGPAVKKLQTDQLQAAHRIAKNKGAKEHQQIAAAELKSRGINEASKQLVIKSADLKKVDKWLDSEGLGYDSKTNLGGGKIRLTFSNSTAYDYACDAAGCAVNEGIILEYEKYTDKKGVTWNDEGDSDQGHTDWGRGPKLKAYKKPISKPATSGDYGPTIKSKFGDHKVRLNKTTGKWEKVNEEVEQPQKIQEHIKPVSNTHYVRNDAEAICEKLIEAGLNASVEKSGPVYRVVVEGMGRAETLKLISEMIGPYGTEFKVGGDKNTDWKPNSKTPTISVPNGKDKYSLQDTYNLTSSGHLSMRHLDAAKRAKTDREKSSNMVKHHEYEEQHWDELRQRSMHGNAEVWKKLAAAAKKSADSHRSH